MRAPSLTNFCFLLLGAPCCLLAQELEAYRGWTVSGVELHGLDRDTASSLKRGLALAATSGLLSTQRAPFAPEKLEEDVQRAVLFLARRGYPYARVTASVEPRLQQQRLEVDLRIEPGPAVVAAAVAVDSIPPWLATKAQAAVRLASGTRLEDTAVEESTKELVSLLLVNGHARAHVVPQVDWLDSTRVRVRFVARPGPVYSFGDVIVQDLGSDLVGLARKTMGIRRGSTYSPAALQDARENLRTLNLFQQTRLEIEDAASDTVDVVACLVERRPTNVDVSLRYWTDEQVQGAARWTHRNLFKGGRGASAGISVSSFLQRVDGSTWWLALAGPNTAVITTLRAERESEESFKTASAGGILSLRYNRSFKTSTTVGIDVSHVEVTDLSTGSLIGAQDGLLTALQLEANRRDTDDPITATRGTSTGLRVEWAPATLGSDNSYVSGLAGAALYLPVLARTQVGLRLQLGAATPTGDSDALLPNKRFFSGGAVSHRGFHRRKLGPLDAAGAPIGGQAKLESSFELRFPLFWKLRGTAFVDAGQVWPTVDDVRIANVEVAVGPGLWLQTLIGPIRSDVGFRITEFEPSQPRWVFHFSVGPAF